MPGAVEKGFSHGIDGSAFESWLCVLDQVTESLCKSQFSHLYGEDSSIDCTGLFGGLNAVRQVKS